MQTFSDFEWVVVDDGSTNGTKEQIEKRQKSAVSNLLFLAKNQHKKVAINKRVVVAEGELILIADSDDRFLPQAMERFDYHWRSIPEGEGDGFIGVKKRRKLSTMVKIGEAFCGIHTCIHGRACYNCSGQKMPHKFQLIHTGSADAE